MGIRQFIAVTLLSCCLSILGGCLANHAVSPDAGMKQSIIYGAGFKHRIFQQPGKGLVLHIYIEGDGQAWLNRHRIASDPTPANPLMLRLMALDTAESVYIGRPCYFSRGFVVPLEDPACSAYWWTSGRYSEKVVNSMAQVIAQLGKKNSAFVFIGHSGGGTLATLLAQRSDKTLALVTAAANLNLSAWADFHQYTPLYGSLDPSLMAQLSQEIVQLHYLGSKDREIKPQWQERFLMRHSRASLILLTDVSHEHGWEAHWPVILQQLESEL